MLPVRLEIDPAEGSITRKQSRILAPLSIAHSLGSLLTRAPTMDAE